MLTLSPSSAPYADLTVMLRSELKHLRGHELTLDYSFFPWTLSESQNCVPTSCFQISTADVLMYLQQTKLQSIGSQVV